VNTHLLEFSHHIATTCNRQAILDIIGTQLNEYIEELDKSDPCPAVLDELHAKLEACSRIKQFDFQTTSVNMN
jgi:hypothetical protein